MRVIEIVTFIKTKLDIVSPKIIYYYCPILQMEHKYLIENGKIYRLGLNTKKGVPLLIPQEHMYKDVVVDKSYHEKLIRESYEKSRFGSW